jgi:alpha-beta hydrolase superfamily lysophospholipase
MDAYADDLAELMESLDLRDVMLVGHSTGDGVVALEQTSRKASMANIRKVREHL